MPDFRFLLKVSRPRFWVYIFGPYLIGLVAGAVTKYELLDWRYFIFAIYFLFPANLLIYGVNDIFDYETDRLNTKKTGYETLLRPEHWLTLGIAIAAFNISFIVLAAIVSPYAILALAAFLFFSIAYSAPPIRAKTKPFLDSAFNILYILPGVFAYKMIGAEYPPIEIIAAGALWTAAMHAYSAIPDIKADREARLSTIATVLGHKATHIFCIVCYTASMAFAYPYIRWMAAVLGVVYIVMMTASIIFSNSRGVFTVYKAFPLINAGSGFTLFWFVAWHKFL